jgi:hypothetical protein
VLCATRPLIELVLRRRAEALANITLRPATRVTGIVPAAGGDGVRGIRFVNGSGGSEPSTPIWWSTPPAADRQR